MLYGAGEYKSKKKLKNQLNKYKKHNKKDAKYAVRGPYRTQPVQTNSLGDRPNLVYPINYKGEEIWPNKQWVWSKERMMTAIEKDDVEITKTDKGYSIRSKQYLKDENGNIRKGKPTSLLNGPFNQEATKEVAELFGGKKIFDFPKPASLIKILLSLEINDNSDKDFIAMDFFAGSGVIAQAVLDLNKEDGGNRKFICVQLPEPTNETSEAYKAGYKTIAEISKERIRRVIKKIEEEIKTSQKTLTTENTPKLDLGFKVFKLDRSNFKKWDNQTEELQTSLTEHVEQIKSTANPEDVLYEVLLKDGFELTTKIEKTNIKGKEVFSIESNLRLICLDDKLDLELFKEMKKLNPRVVIVLDKGFKDNDQLKTNAVQTLGKNSDGEYILRSI